MNIFTPFNMYFRELVICSDYERNQIISLALCEDNVKSTLTLTYGRTSFMTGTARQFAPMCREIRKCLILGK